MRSIFMRRPERSAALRYDRVYYVGENEFYVPRNAKGDFESSTDLAAFFPKTLEVMRKLTPTHVVFEGKVGHQRSRLRRVMP